MILARGALLRYTDLTMRYTHNLKLIRKRKHAFKISIVLTILAVLLILVLGFTELDARLFFFGFLQSLGRVVVAYFLTLLLATSLIIFITSSQAIEDVALPLLDALQSFPAFAILPLLLVWFGRSDFVVVVILMMEMLWPILFSVLSAQKQLRPDLLEAAQSFGATGHRYFFYVLAPLLFPSVVTGSIVAWGEAWETIIAAEIIVNVAGVGSYLAAPTNTSKILIIGTFLLLVILFILNKYIWLPLLNLSTRYQQE